MYFNKSFGNFTGKVIQFQNSATWNCFAGCPSGRGVSKVGIDSSNYDVVVVGGGIVGVATARELKERNPQLRMTILEKEKGLAFHQSGHNSGVIHAGIYYKPGSLKAKLCVEGLHLTYKYCDSKKIPYKKVGKLIVATNQLEVKRLHELQERGIQNKVPDLKLLKGEAAIKEIEPHCTGLEALWSPQTGIVDWGLVTRHYGKDFQENGGDIQVDFEVNGFKDSGNTTYPVLITAKSGKTVKSKYVLTCGGLQSDCLAELSGCPRSPRIVPFRGEYLLLKPDKAKMINGNIYPVPDPRFPFLGVHFTPRMDGSVWLGPNAVLAFQREGYKWSDINIKELIDAVSYPGFVKMALKFTLAGFNEIAKSLYTPLQVKELQKFVPSIRTEDVEPGPSGVRAQALDELDTDCLITRYSDVSDVLNACKDIVVKSLQVPGGVTLELDLQNGTTLTFIGTILFGFKPWSGPLIRVKGSNITIQGDTEAVTVLDGQGFLYWDGKGDKGMKKPQFMKIEVNDGSIIRNLNVLNCPHHCIYVGKSDGLTISGWNIDVSGGDYDNFTAHNTDGFDISGAKNLIIENTKVYNQDDCVAIRYGSDITIRNLYCSGGHGLSLSVGFNKTSFPENVVSNVLIENCIVARSANAIHLKTHTDGWFGEIRNITYRNLELIGITNYGINIQQDYADGQSTGVAKSNIPINSLTFSNIRGTMNGSNDSMAIRVFCADGACSDWDWSGIDICNAKQANSCNYSPENYQCQ